MAAKLVVAVAVLALCHANPIIINGVLYRDARTYSLGQATNYGNGASQASANISPAGAQAYGNSYNTGAQLTRNDGFVDIYPGQGVAKAEVYDTPLSAYGSAKATAQTQNGAYYPVPAPATVITYEQNFVPAEVSYEIPVPGALSAQSSAVSNGMTDSSVSSANTNGAGQAQSSAQTTRGAGTYGVTSSNANTYGSGFGSAASNANNGYNSAVTAAKSQGYGSASSSAQTNGFDTAVVANEILEPTIIAARTQGPSYGSGFGSASSNANVNGQYGNAAASANTNNANQRGIYWRFGTLYDTPAGSAKAQANTNGFGGAAKAAANTQGYGAANANADLNAGYGAAKSTAKVNGADFGSAKSSVNTNGYGSANANADVNNAGYVKSAANSNGFGSALSSANTGSGYGLSKSSANTLGSYGGAKTVTDARTNGFGSASSSAKSQGLTAAYRVANSAANSSGHGTAQANALSA